MEQEDNYASAHRFEEENGEFHLTQLSRFWDDVNSGYGFETLDEKFRRLTHYLMNRLCLDVAGRIYRLTELEIYYHNEKNHCDPYVHRSPEQLTSCRWYFNGSGLDITFGDYDRRIYGGILIRGIMKFGEPTIYISGPANVLKEIFSTMGNITDGKNGICLRELNSEIIASIEMEPIQSVRIGLTKKQDDSDNYVEKKYRYIVALNPQHKFKDKEKVIRQLWLDGKITREQAKDIMGYNSKL